MHFRRIRCWLLILSLSLLAIAATQDVPTQRTPASSESSSKPHASTARPKAATLDAGAIANGAYRNAFFGFTYKIPVGWVERTPDMQEDSEPGKSQVLLAIFERPPEAAGDTVNSAVIIAAESTSSYPGLKTAADYFEPVTELTTSKGFKVVNQPYDFSAGAGSLVRADFSKELGNLTMYQSSVAVLQKGYVLSLTFIGGSEDAVNELIEKLSFSGTKPSPSPKSAPSH
jgi:hypothetical protein